MGVLIELSTKNQPKMKILLFLLFFIFVSLTQQSTPSDFSYEAGVVEFAYESDIFSKSYLSSHLEQYLKIMEDAPSNLDIIVFPEMTLNILKTAVEIPEVGKNISPCTSEDYSADNLVKKISCAARSFRRYVVVNIVTKAKCPDPEMIANNDPRSCKDREDGFSYYNTNVVFDREGILISRYRKFNLFVEEVDRPYKPALVTFNTDFGVQFGQFICFDLVFRRPALDLVRTALPNITDIIFPTMWFSELPFYTAVQIQQNWAHANNVNFLAAGANNPDLGSTGTGIYAGNLGSIISVMEGKSDTKLYTATVPKKSFNNSNQKINHTAIRYTKEQMKTLELKRDQLDAYKLDFLEVPLLGAIANYEKKVCQDRTCCNFKISYKVENPLNKPHYSYAVGFYHGKLSFDGKGYGGVIACAVIACQSTNVSTCAVRNEELETVHVFDEIEITGELPFDDDQFAYLPTSLDTSILPLSPEKFHWNQNTATSTVNGVTTATASISMRSKENIKDILTFGFHGRDFNLDSDKDAAGMKEISTGLLATCLVFVVLRSFI